LLTPSVNSVKLSSDSVENRHDAVNGSSRTGKLWSRTHLARGVLYRPA
jgi:hypothetical protein